MTPDPINHHPKGHHMTRHLLAALAITLVTLVTCCAIPAKANSSGTLGDWTTLTHTRSSTGQFTYTATHPTGVWIYGDSITNASWVDLRASLLNRGQYLAVDAWSGRPTTPALDALEDDVARYGAPPVVILALGTNDIFDPDVMPFQVGRALRAVPATTRVVWVNVSAQRAGTYDADRANSDLVNDALNDHATEMTIVRWKEFLDGKPGRITYYLRDGVHPNDYGVKARNALLLRAVPVP